MKITDPFQYPRFEVAVYELDERSDYAIRTIASFDENGDEEANELYEATHTGGAVFGVLILFDDGEDCHIVRMKDEIGEQECPD